jgi:hypothetical protein
LDGDRLIRDVIVLSDNLLPLVCSVNLHCLVGAAPASRRRALGSAGTTLFPAPGAGSGTPFAPRSRSHWCVGRRPSDAGQTKGRAHQLLLGPELPGGFRGDPED